MNLRIRYLLSSPQPIPQESIPFENSYCSNQELDGIVSLIHVLIKNLRQTVFNFPEIDARKSNEVAISKTAWRRD